MPEQVEEYVTGGDLVERLEDLYGLSADGSTGIDFDETTKTGPISRVWTWTAERLAGEVTEHPTELTNNWVTSISIDKQPVGYATVWINPELDAPELAEFDPDPEAAVALSEVPDDAQLVRDDASSAWFALEDGILTPLVPGTSGLETPAPVDEVALLPPETAEPAPTSETSSTGLVSALAVFLALLVVIGVSVYFSRRRDEDDDLS